MTSETPNVSDELKSFYEEQGVDVAQVLLHPSTRHRFVRFNPRFERKESLKLLHSELCASLGDNGSVGYPKAVDWLDGFGFYSIPGAFSLSQSSCYRSGRIYGQDVTSGAAVAALMSSRFDAPASDQSNNDPCDSWRVLDLCCSPGLKLCAMADWLAAQHGSIDQSTHSIVVVGVDVSKTRLAVCQKNLEKYWIDPQTSSGGDKYHPSRECRVHIQLYCNDGTVFGKEDLNLVFDSNIATEHRVTMGSRKRRNKSARARERKRLKQVVSDGSRNRPTLFDRVLVDAECSTDGSFKHVQQRAQKLLDRRVDNSLLTCSDKLNDLVALQRRLASSGFELLKPGGFMVYSTCSLSDLQNEGIVQWLLQKYSRAELVPLKFEAMNAGLSKLSGTVRFSVQLDSPRRDGTDLSGEGFFVAKVRKRLDPMS